MNTTLDEYTRKIFDFLDVMPYYKVYTVDKICKLENRDKFIAAIKLYIDVWPYGGGVAFLTEDYKQLRKIQIPEPALKALMKQS